MSIFQKQSFWKLVEVIFRYFNLLKILNHGPSRGRIWPCFSPCWWLAWWGMTHRWFRKIPWLVCYHQRRNRPKRKEVFLWKTWRPQYTERWLSRSQRQIWQRKEDCAVSNHLRRFWERFCRKIRWQGRAARVWRSWRGRLFLHHRNQHVCHRT